MVSHLGKLKHCGAHGLVGDADHSDCQADVEEDGGAGDRGTHEHDLRAERRAGGRAPAAAAAHGDEPVDAEAHDIPHGQELRQRPDELDELTPAAETIEMHIEVVGHPRVQSGQQAHGVDHAQSEHVLTRGACREHRTGQHDAADEIAEEAKERDAGQVVNVQESNGRL